MFLPPTLIQLFKEQVSLTVDPTGAEMEVGCVNIDSENEPAKEDITVSNGAEVQILVDLKQNGPSEGVLPSTNRACPYLYSKIEE